MEMPLNSNSITERFRMREQVERRAGNFENVLAARVKPAVTPEARFQEFRFPTEQPSTLLRRLLEEEHYIFAPGLYNAGGVKLAAYAGFKAAYLSGYSYALEEHGITDVGAFSRSELAEQARRMVRASDLWVREQYVQHGQVRSRLPLIADLEDGHGGFGQVQTLTHLMVQAGVAAGHLEDQAERRCGHLPGKVLVTVDKQIERLLAARSEADQLGYDDFVLIARTDAIAVEGFEAAIERGRLYEKAGADVIFVEAPRTRQQLAAIPPAFGVPALLNVGASGKTPMLGAEEARELGFSLAIYPNFVILAAIPAVRRALKELKEKGSPAALLGEIAGFTELFDLLGMAEIQELEERYGVSEEARVGY